MSDNSDRTAEMSAQYEGVSHAADLPDKDSYAENQTSPRWAEETRQ